MSLKDTQPTPSERQASPIPGPSNAPDSLIEELEGEIEILAPPVFVAQPQVIGPSEEEVYPVSGMDIDHGETYGLQPNDRAAPAISLISEPLSHATELNGNRLSQDTSTIEKNNHVNWQDITH